MSRIFNPSKCVDERALRAHRGFVSRAEELPVADVKYFGLVIFCAEDKRFYECQHIITKTEDYYKWVAVTSGAQRTFFIPVERLTENETPRVPEPSIRTNCFDAIASALNEMAIGLYRYNIKINPLSYAPCYDATYVDGKKYYVWNDNYDRADYVRTADIQPIEGKPYFAINSGVYETKIFTADQSFEDGVTYYESTRPIMIPDEAYAAGAQITHRVFVAEGTAYNDLTKRDLVAKTNEIVELINTTHAKLDKATDDGSLYDLAVVANKLIDEVNPFSIPWSKLLQRVDDLERRVQAIEQQL